MKRTVIPIATLLLIAGCSSHTTTGRFFSQNPQPTASVAGPSKNVPRAMLNPAVNQGNIKDNICKSGYTDTIRPPSSFTTNLKKNQLIGKKDQDPTHYEEDHWIPLELGGNPVEQSNLWPEPIDEARKKDIKENADHRSVCAGTMTLEEAQLDMYKNWGPR